MGDTSARPSDGSASSWSDILEETPDPHGAFWVTTEIAAKLIPRIESAGPLRVDPRLLQSLLEVTTDLSSSVSPLDPELP